MCSKIRFVGGMESDVLTSPPRRSENINISTYPTKKYLPKYQSKKSEDCCRNWS